MIRASSVQDFDEDVNLETLALASTLALAFVPGSILGLACPNLCNFSFSKSNFKIKSTYGKRLLGIIPFVASSNGHLWRSDITSEEEE
ncbi:hypothetical protein BCON_0229g00130 [Botryotinia convoluta]|uniref:Uncharacterized protein n=1 Tax=Botryotinia convoluta TaxID=54673 RepID=A0A4Z1HJI9_9HELO|nr:hypothetical protein BCON_0229g00130 [Botryotinia convoluta]